MDAKPDVKKYKNEIRKVLLLLVGAVIGVFWLLIIIFALSQITAIGFRPAWDKYHRDWITYGLASIGAVILVGFGFSVFFGIDVLIRKVFPKTFTKIYDVLSNLFLIGVGLFLLFLIIFFGHKSAREGYEKFPELNSNETAVIADAVNKQSESLKELSGRASELLNQLGATETLIQDNKKKLAATLTDIAKQVTSVDEANKNMSSLVERQKQIELRTAELERILEGQSPISKRDLDNASKWGWIQGIGTSIIATILILFAKNIMTRLRRKPSSPVSQPEP